MKDPLYNQLIGECATADGGKVECRPGDIGTIVGATFDFVYEELKKTNINFSDFPRLEMVVNVAKARAKRKPRKA